MSPFYMLTGAIPFNKIPGTPYNKCRKHVCMIRDVTVTNERMDMYPDSPGTKIEMTKHSYTRGS